MALQIFLAQCSETPLDLRKPGSSKELRDQTTTLEHQAVAFRRILEHGDIPLQEAPSLIGQDRPTGGAVLGIEQGAGKQLQFDARVHAMAEAAGRIEALEHRTVYLQLP